MSQPKTDEVSLDFVLYLGDPDDGAESIDSAKALESFETIHEKLPFDDELYGALCIRRDGEEIGPRTPDPIVKLLTGLVRILPYIIEGEPETAMLSETERGYLFEPNADKVVVAFFAGYDAYEPDEYLIEGETMPLLKFGPQLLDMAQRMLDLLKKHDAELFEDDEYTQDLFQMHDLGKKAFRSYRLEKERGLR